MSSVRPTAVRDRAAAPRAIALAGLLVTPFALAFASGGYFDRARLVALVGVCLVLLLVAAVVPGPLPRDRAGVLAVAGLWALTAWTGASIGWAPLRGPAFHDMQRLLLYAISFTAAIPLLRRLSPARAIEPAVAAGGTIVMAYGLAGRLLPGLVHEKHGAAAGGRLDQPLTYWNAVGALAAITLVICARLAGDPTRRSALRAAAASACAPVGMALYLTYSRGALGAAGAGLLVLLAVAHDRRQLRALVVCVAAAVAGALAAAPFPVVASLGSGRRVEGVAALALLGICMALAALASERLASAEDGGRLRTDPLGMRALRPLLAVAAVAVVVGFAIATATTENRSASRNPATGATATRLASLKSHRYAYWKVALGAFRDHPLIGLGSGGFQVRWLQRRQFPEAVRDAHSLYIETAAELGLIGLAALACWLAGIALSARAALRANPILAAGPVAGLVAWAAQAAVDWLWEMPSVSLVALLLAALLVAQGEPARSAAPA